MAKSQRERKITVILAADVVGFSQMMGDDEQRTLRNLQECRAITDKLIAKQKGRVFGSAGDSVIAELPSAVAAVRCSTQIQHALAGRNARKTAEDQMRLRIGVNLGDVLVEGENLFGDGVNIAARLEPLAEPGGICISGAVYDLVGSKLALDIEPLGPTKLKNIAEPVPVYKVVTEAENTRQESSGDALAPAEPEPEIYRWTSIVSLVAILSIVAFAMWHYAGK